jgi:hypothetical protein
MYIYWCQLIGGWIISWPIFHIEPFRVVVSVPLVDSSVCPTRIRHSRPIQVARAWITTLFSGKEVRFLIPVHVAAAGAEEEVNKFKVLHLPLDFNSLWRVPKKEWKRRHHHHMLLLAQST